MSHLYTLLTEDLVDIPHRFLSSLTRNADFDHILTAVIRMVLIGLFATGLRRLFSWSSNIIRRALFPTAYIAHTDPSYLWIMAWIAQDPNAQRQIQDFQLSATDRSQVRKKNGNALRSAKGLTPGQENCSWASKEIIGQVLPTYHQSIRIKWKGTYLWVTRKMGSFARTQLRTVDHLQIRTVALQPDALKGFLIAAHQAYFAKEEQELLIFHAKRINPTWQLPVSRPARPWSSVILPGTMKQDILQDMEKFLSEKEVSWYAARGIPHRRGYLFHGDPGAGKTTLATAIASKLGLDIYVINPSQRGMDDAKLSKLFRDCPARSIILIEDIDCIFPRNRYGRGTLQISMDGNDTDSITDVPPEAEPERSSETVVRGNHDLAPSTVTLSGVLNAIDGVSSQEGCILIASTNHPEHLDPALSRAGRFDVHVPFSNAIPDQAKALYLHFYPLSDFINTANEKNAITSQSDLDNLATEFTNAIFQSQANEAIPKKDNADDSSGNNDSGISMAALQGYLLRYKDDPILAVSSAGEWARSIDSKKSGKFVSSLLAPPPTPTEITIKPTIAGKKKKPAKKASPPANSSGGSPLAALAEE